MSIQSDAELLSVRAMEEYAKRNHISTLSAVEIFHKYQVFEKIMLQHEYLHQVDFAEVMEYVETVIQLLVRLQMIIQWKQFSYI